MGVRGAFSARAGFAGLAVAGLVAGHCLAVRLFASGPHAHHHGGHSHAPYLVALVAGLLVALVGSFVEARLTRERSVLATAAALMVLQVGGFLGLSLIDRIAGAAGTEPGSKAFWFGLALQVVVAAVGAVVFALLRKTAEVVRRLLDRPLPIPAADPSSEILPSFDVALPALAMAAGGPTFRGPPRPTA